MNSDATVVKLAGEVYSAFEQDTRNDGATFWKLRDGSPAWMVQLCHHAHGEYLPDDWRYEFIVDAVSALDDLGEDGDPDEALDTIEPEVYTAKLTAWLASNVNRLGFMGEAIEEFGVREERGDTFGKAFALLQQAQYMEQREVFGLVLDFLRNEVEVDEEGAD